MKRALSIFILCAYLSSALGIDLNVHFCAGKFDSIAFASDNNKGCKCSGESFAYKPGLNKKVKTCCKDLHVHCSFASAFENESSQVVETSNDQILLVHFKAIESFGRNDFLRASIHSKLHFSQLRKIPIFLSIRVLRL